MIRKIGELYSMPIEIQLNLLLAYRGKCSKELSEEIGITEQKLLLLVPWNQSVRLLSVNQEIY